MQCVLLELLKSPVLLSMQAHNGWKSWTPTTEAQDIWGSITILLRYFPHILPTGNTSYTGFQPREATFEFACTSFEGFRMPGCNQNTDTHKHILNIFVKNF